MNDRRQAGKAAKTAAILFAGFLLWGIPTHYSCQSQPVSDVGRPADLMPKGDVKGWKAVDQPEVYFGEDLFLYINGGAEIYHEYGFRSVAVQDFENESGQTIVLEIYEMEGSDGAFGIYSVKTSPGGETLRIGESRAQLEDYYLNLRKGHFLVTLTGFDADDVTVGGLIALAERVASEIEAEDAPPDIVSLLPVDGLEGGSVKYFRGPLGLMNSHRFFITRVLMVREGVRGDYSAGYSRFILAYDSDEEALTHWNSLARGFSEENGYQNFTRAGASEMQAEQPGNIGLRAGRDGNRIVIVRGDRDIVKKAVLFTERNNRPSLVEGLDGAADPARMLRKNPYP